ncbi:ClbS/DfsB family four-helix bundle protein [Halovulum sp. GXIMD14793]
MPATSKQDLLQVTRSEFAKLEKLIQPVGAKAAFCRDEDDTTIKDIIGHRAHWIDLFLGWYADGQAGREVFFPAKGYKWNDLKRYNADLRARQTDMGWEAARDTLQAAHGKLVAFLESQDDAALYGEPMQGARNSWTTGRWAEAAGPSHYRSASKYIRKRLKEIG